MLKRCLIISFIIFSLAAICLAGEAVVTDTPEYIIYIPSGIDSQRNYPLVIALSPSGDARSMISTWKDVAEEYKWLILASKGFKNGIVNYQAEFSGIKSIIENPANSVPADKSKIIVSGFSGGGMGAHIFSFLYPELISGVVVNTGMIQEEYIKQKGQYPRGKSAVFLASPADFRYQEMKRDREFLRGLGWKTEWIEFPEGHTIAPGRYYKEAAQWLSVNLE
jgi:predicted esterase